MRIVLIIMLTWTRRKFVVPARYLTARPRVKPPRILQLDANEKRKRRPSKGCSSGNDTLAERHRGACASRSKRIDKTMLVVKFVFRCRQASLRKSRIVLRYHLSVLDRNGLVTTCQRLGSCRLHLTKPHRLDDYKYWKAWFVKTWWKQFRMW